MSRAKKSLLVVGVVVVIAVILTAPLPFVRSRIVDGTSPVGSLRTLNTAEITYASTYPQVGYTGSLAALGGTSGETPSEQHAGLVDPNLASGKKVGYLFTCAVTRDEKSGTNIAYEAHANPDPNVKLTPREASNLWELMFPPKPVPRRYFYSDQSGVIRYEKDHEANASSPPL